MAKNKKLVLGRRELSTLIYVLDSWQEDLSESQQRPYIKLAKKLSLELKRRGYTTPVSKIYLGEYELHKKG